MRLNVCVYALVHLFHLYNVGLYFHIGCISVLLIFFEILWFLLLGGFLRLSGFQYWTQVRNYVEKKQEESLMSQEKADNRKGTVLSPAS